MQKNNQTKHQLLKSDIQRIIWFTALLWVIKSAETLFGFEALQYGVYPRDVSGLFGVLTAPMIHGSWSHLAANTPSVLLLGIVMAYGYPKSKWWTIAVIWVVSGLGVWLFGRESYHIGASGLTHGAFYFLFVAAILRRDKRSIALMLIAVFMHGGMMLGVLPWDPEISFEGHLFGGLAGAISAILFRHRDPKPETRLYEWERDDYEDELEPEDYHAASDSDDQSFQNRIIEDTTIQDTTIQDTTNNR